ncbi:GNAT family N-acetyltransferase [Deinococcus sp. D7000]|nr:GNAT family N-acetyltransferase [Deinococcus sp. D7000]
MLVTLRATVPEDLPAIMRLLNADWNGDGEAIAYHGGGRVLGVVAMKGRRIVGYASAQRKALHPRHTYIGVHVHPDERGQGIGAALWNEVTAALPGSLKTALCDDDPVARHFLGCRGLRVSVETYQPTLELAHLNWSELERWKAEAQALGYELLPMTAPDGPEAWHDVIRLHAEVYAHSHRHEAPDPATLAGLDFLDDDFNPAWLWLARKDGVLAGVSSILPNAETTQGELGYFGVPAAFGGDGPALTVALTAAALQAAARGGISSIEAELDSADPNALALWSALPWTPGRGWLTLISA